MLYRFRKLFLGRLRVKLDIYALLLFQLEWGPENFEFKSFTFVFGSTSICWSQLVSSRLVIVFLDIFFSQIIKFFFQIIIF